MLKQKFLLVALIALLISILVGCSSSDKKQDNLLTLNDVTDAFSSEGISLLKAGIDEIDLSSIDSKRPEVLENREIKDDLFMVYVFDSFSEKENEVKKIREGVKNFKETKKDTYSSFIYEAKNIVVVYFLKNNKELNKKLDAVQRVVFDKLNEGSIVVFAGQSNSWKAEINLKYYKNRFEENGKLLYDHYFTLNPQLEYNKSDIDNVGKINYRYRSSTTDGGNGEGFLLNDDGYVKLGSIGGNGAIPDADEEFIITVEWNGNEEVIELKAQ